MLFMFIIKHKLPQISQYRTVKYSPMAVEGKDWNLMKAASVKCSQEIFNPRGKRSRMTRVIDCGIISVWSA